MRYSHITPETLADFITRLDAAFGRPGSLYLIGETTQVFEGWRRWTTQIEFTAEVAPQDREHFSRVVRVHREQMGVRVFDESPGDVVPLPDGYETRARPAGMGERPIGGTYVGDGTLDHLKLFHFDPYSVAFRFIARGDEPDYHLVLTFLEQGWLTVAEMNAKLEKLLPRFTAESIQQDPAEFRRKSKGLLQMWHSGRPRATHRMTTV